MTWQISSNEHYTCVRKLCNECGGVIDTFGPDHPVTMTMMLDLGLDENSDLSQLDLGLQPYHWHEDVKKYPNCLVPLPSYEYLKRKEQKRREAEEEALKQKPHFADELPLKKEEEQPKETPNVIQHGENYVLERKGLVFIGPKLKSKRPTYIVRRGRPIKDYSEERKQYKLKLFHEEEEEEKAELRTEDGPERAL